MEKPPAWYERYEQSVKERYQGLGNVPLRYYPSYKAVRTVLEESLSHPAQINDVLWEQLSHADPRVGGEKLRSVYRSNSWEGQKALREVIKELVFGAKPFNEEDWL